MKTLFRYEFQKIVARAMVWVVLAVSLLLILVTISSALLGNYYADGEYIGSNYEMFQVDKGYQHTLDGRLIDTELLGEMLNAYSKVNLTAEQYSLTEEYQRYARPYSAIFNYVRQSTGLSGQKVLTLGTSAQGQGKEANAENLRVMRLERQEKRWEDFYLTKAEKTYWRGEEEKIENPVTFRYVEGYATLFSAVYTIGLLAIFTVALCLSGVFAEEHIRRTDQLILSSPLGRGKIFFAKFLAGLAFALLLTILFALVAFGAAFLLYGAEGFDGAFQLIYAGSSLPISVGEAVLIAYFMVIVAGVFTGALTMMLSQVLGNGVGAMAIITGMIMLPMFFTMPEEYRVLGQLWSYLPSDFVAGWSTFSPQTVVLGHKVFLPHQVVPILYMGLGAVCVLVGKRSFVKYQVSGR